MNNKLLKIFKYYGAKHQLKKLKEEQKEVRQAIKWLEVVKKEKSNKELSGAYKKHVAEEIADNFVLLGQFMVAYNIDKDYIEKVIEYKIERTLEERGRERRGR